ncbi:class I SAM-dependent RNA methyltransferase [candidate division WOR-3 bacterium]|nr:class I SAM-dependent RNA methyltransferase [candidate division WOR-3 bacterium]
MKIHTVTVEKNTGSGEGLSRIDGKVVFIPFAVAGETVDVKIVQSFGDFDRAEILSYRKRLTSPELVKCPYFYICGGCSYQHLNREKETEIKIKTAEESATRAGFSFLLDGGMIIGDRRYGYRSRLTLAMRKEGEIFKAGFFGKKTDVFHPIESCLLAEESVNSKIDSALDVSEKLFSCFCRVKKISVGTFEDGEGAAFFAENFEKEKLPKDGISSGFTSSVLRRSEADGNQIFEVLEGKRRMQLTFDKNLLVTCGSFTQANKEITAKILDLIKKRIRENDWLIDLYCGSGFFSLQLEDFAKKIIGIDADQYSVMDAVVNARELDIQKARYFNLPDRNIGPEILKKNSTVIIDPPRSGINSGLLKRITEKKCRDIIYLSCSFPTFLRDLKILSSAGYSAEKVFLFDMFPLTPHIEALVFLREGEKN